MIQISYAIGIACTFASNVKRKQRNIQVAKCGRSKLGAMHGLGSISCQHQLLRAEQKAFLINLQVENLDEVLAQLKREGVDVDPRVESYDYGKFGWIIDPEGNRVELWEPPSS
jgi:predicted enzyme related to lactoylglutathione lyase